MSNGEQEEIVHVTTPSVEQREGRESVHESAVSEALGPRIFKNVVTLVGGQGLSLVLSGVATILLARYLGTAQLGEFGAIYAYLGLYGWLATFGLDTILARHAAQNREQAGSILLTGIVVSSFFAVGATAIALLAAPSFGYGGSLRSLLVVASVDILLLAPLRLTGIMFQVDLRQWYGVGIGLVRQIAWLAVLVGAAAADRGLMWIIAGRCFCAVLEVALILLAVRHKRFLAGPWRLLRAEAWSFVTYGFPVAISALAVGIYHRIDQVMLHKMVNDQILGNYVAAARLAELVNMFPIALMASLFPILTQSANQEDRFRHFLQLSFRSLMVIALAGCILATLFAARVVEIIYGAQFVSAGPLLAVLIWSEVPVFFGVVMSSGLVAKNLQNYLPLSTGVGAVVNISLNFYLIPRWGAMGAAWATNISYTLAGIILFLAFAKTRPLAWLGFRILVPPCALALAVTAILRSISLPEIMRVCVALLLYGVGAWLLGSIRREDMNQLSRLVIGLSKFHAA